MKLATTLVKKGCHGSHVCSALEVSRATFYRYQRPPFQGPPKRRPSPANRIPEVVRLRILELLNSDRFVDLTPWEIVPRLLDEGLYHGCIRTYYRILSEQGAVLERRMQSKREKHAAPILEANGPNQVWTWDITRLKGPVHGKWYFLYLMLDLYSRYIVGWMVAEHESARKAQHFIRETVHTHLENGDEVTIHSDRGAPMTANTTRELLSLLGITQSLSRPRTSDDNPFSEAQFRTIKYHSSFPGFFNSREDAVSYLDQLLTEYNHEHRHVGLNLHTPASVHFGKVDEIVKRRQEVLDVAYAANPERFPKGPPIVKANPPVVGINLHLKATPLNGGETGMKPSEKVERTIHNAEILH